MFLGETVLSGAPSHIEDSNVSEFKIMRSAAGWYVGTTYNEDGYEVPNSRETGYFGSEAEAAQALAHWNTTGELPNQR